ncbi:carbon-nitrogen hydrolase family protein [Halomonas aquamarina]|uniref:Carbon-nitrogen hydrolase family protein n=1 Tax=Vreelandella aquamarina TaxID=77097 RepID=A0ACC5VX32_9GAMM|nr:carbon-nitrogen hydrolase family protein [Halomonas aquamarina]MBZ5488079.1 carbon-nitrogen hydrolase family protein [Halomonas aquamarina]
MNSSSITIGLAQLPVAKGAVSENLATHLAYIERVAKDGADVVVFPELSLTGYELALLEELAMPKTSDVFNTLSSAAVQHNIVVIAGCPLHNEDSKPHIGAVICFPSGEREFYAKQYLHEGEDVYCSSGTQHYLFTVNDMRIALAVCADFANPAHIETAVAQQAQVYIASALISEAGYEADAKLLASMAQRHQVPVLLSNHLSITGGWQTCGNSGGWNAEGELIVAADGTEPSLVLCHIHQGQLIEGMKNHVSSLH